MFLVHQLRRVVFCEPRISVSGTVFDEDIEGSCVRLRGGWFPFLLDGNKIVVVVIERIVRF